MHTALAILKVLGITVVAGGAFYGIYRLAKWRMGASSGDAPITRGGSGTGGTPQAPK
jgi:hypothetical protein